MTVTKSKGHSATAMDVQNGDTIIDGGYRWTVSDVRHFEGVARYTLTHAPGNGYDYPPVGFERITAGGNELAKVFIENR